MDIAIIGAGNVGRALATAALRTGHAVTASSSNGATAAKLAEDTGARARAPTSWYSPCRTPPW